MPEVVADWDQDAVRIADVPVVAADAGNRIVAVSESVAARRGRRYLAHLSPAASTNDA